MGVVFRQTVKSSITIFLGALLGALTIFYSTHFLPQQELGFRQTLITVAAAAGQILLVGLHNMVSVYIHKYEDGKRKTALITLSIILPVIIIGLATIFYYIFRDSIVHHFRADDIYFIQRYFSWLPVFVVLFAYNVLMETILISHLVVAKATFIREIILRILHLILIFLFGFGYIDFDTLVYSTVLVYSIPLLILTAIALKRNFIQFSLKLNVFNPEEKKEIVHFTWYHSLLSISVILLGTIDVMMLASLSKNGLTAVGIYAVAVFIISFFQVPYKAMLNSTFTILTQAFMEDNKERVKEIYIRSSMNIMIASCAMLLLICSNLHNAIAILPPGFETIALIVPILAIGRMVDTSTGMNDQLLSISRYYKYNFYISLVLVVLIIVFNYWLIPIYDVYGAAWGTSIAVTIYNLIKLFVVKRKLSIQPFTSKTLLVLFATAIAFVAGYFLPRLSNPYIDTIYRSAVIVAIYGGMLLFLKPSDDFQTYITSIKKNKRLF